MVISLNKLRAWDLIRHPWQFNQLVQSSAQRYLEIFQRELTPEMLLLDAGAGQSSIIKSHRLTVCGDVALQNKPDVVFDALSLPFKNVSFDGVVSSWVLEHLEDPFVALDEIYRVLKPSGLLYLTTNMAWHIHEPPRDFFRFTEYGLRHLLPEDRWTVEFLEPTLGLWGTVTQVVSYRVADYFRRSGLSFFHPLFTLPLQLVGLFMEKWFHNRCLCAGYAVVARKLDI